MNYSRGAFKFNVFTNIVDAEAPNLLLADPATGKPIQLNFKTETIDIETSHATAIAGRHALTYGGNYRRNNFDITLAPASKDRNELGAYGQDEILLNKVRLSLGARVDKFGNIRMPCSPRVWRRRICRTPTTRCVCRSTGRSTRRRRSTTISISS
jgi:outer membrane receptor for ferrienterochelin and colicin